jgi:hypothetical protein
MSTGELHERICAPHGLAWMGVLLLRKAPALERTLPRQVAAGLAAPIAAAAERHPER